MNFLREPDSYRIICEDSSKDASIKFDISDDEMKVRLKASVSCPEFVVLRWNEKTEKDVKLLGDAFERSYADLRWRSIVPSRFMPWYFAVTDGKIISCFGVKTGCKSFVSFEYDGEGVSAWFDVRCGAMGVHLSGRELTIGTLVSKEYDSVNEFGAVKDFCRIMCDNPLLPEKPVYGGNNWYYAYGKSSRQDILNDARLQASLAEGLSNRPYMVIDDGWEINKCKGPWLPNRSFGDMASLASEIKAMDVKPGIWVRLLKDDEQSLSDYMYIKRDDERCLDPSVPEAMDYIRETVRKIKGWGYELLKHDFSTYDLFGDWGKDLNGAITKKRNWSFADSSRTSAEIVLDFYTAIKEEAGDMIIIGCNTVSHLTAGLAEVMRTGDDTSGLSWERTRDFGLNSLAFRMCQNNTFYSVDADCVGIIKGKIPWNLNGQWLKLLSESGTVLFTSCALDSLTEEQTNDIKKAYRRASLQKDKAEPVDWTNNSLPSVWLINGEYRRFDWMSGECPMPLM